MRYRTEGTWLTSQLSINLPKPTKIYRQTTLELRSTKKSVSRQQPIPKSATRELYSDLRVVERPDHRNCHLLFHIVIRLHLHILSEDAVA